MVSQGEKKKVEIMDYLIHLIRYNGGKYQVLCI